MKKDNQESKEFEKQKGDLKQRIEEFLKSTENQEVISLSEYKSQKLLVELWRAFNEYSPEMNAYFNGYAQAQADGVQEPLSDSDLQIGIGMQRNKIKELTEQLMAIQQTYDAILIENSRYKKKKDDEQIVREGLWHNFTQMQVICNNKLEEISSLQKKLESAVEALKFYADVENTCYDAYDRSYEYWYDGSADACKIAKAALANIKE